MPGTSSAPANDDVDPGGRCGRGVRRNSNCCAVRCIMIKTGLLLVVVSAYLELLNFPILIYAVVSIFFQKPVIDQNCSTENQLDVAVGVAVVPRPKELAKFDLESLPSEVKSRILEFLGSYEQIFQFRALSKTWKALIDSQEFIQAVSLRQKPTLTACYFFIDNGVWKWAGFHPEQGSGKWRRMPPLAFLPANCNPDADLFKQFLFCAKDGLVCMNFSKSPYEERLIVFNPLLRHPRELPPLLYRRNPVLMHMLVDSSSKSYKVLVAGSSESGDENLSKITELFDSKTGQWKRVGDLPGPAFALNEYQAGVYQKGNLFCIGFLELHDEIVKGILGYSLEEGMWSTKFTDHALPSSPILQLVENSGELYLFSERENGRFTEHWVDRLEWTQKEGDAEKATWKLINVIQKKKIGGRSLEVYPEFALVPYSQWQLCVYNTVDHTGEVFDIQDQKKCEALPALPEKGFRGELGFFSLNPMTFAIEPRFSSKV